MDLALDGLSIFLLCAIVTAALIHVTILRKPEPTTHPLLLGRQSELNHVRKANESPVFISATAGLGGLAKQSLRDSDSAAALWAGKEARIVYGTAEPTEQILDTVVAHATTQLQTQIPAYQHGKPVTIKLDDPTEAFVFALAAQSVTLAESESARLVAHTSSLPNYTQSLLLLAATDLAASIPTLCCMISTNQEAKRHLLVLPAPVLGKQLDLDPVRRAGWTTSLIQPLKNTNHSHSHDSGSAPRMSASNSQSIAFALPNQQSIILLSNQNLINGGIVSVLSMFPSHQRPASRDRILSFESVAAPYGYTVAMTAAHVGASMRLCSSHKGITSMCRNYNPSIIFCSPNELNAFKTAVTNSLRQIGPSPLARLATTLKTGLLRAGSVDSATLWDKLIFKVARVSVVGSQLRCIICSAEDGVAPSYETIEFLRVALGVPIIVALTHSLVAGPITNTLWGDFQRFTGDSSAMNHLGAPSATIECKLTDIDEEQGMAGLYKGSLQVKGPSILQPNQPKQGASWLATGITVELQANGTLKPIQSVR